MASLFCLSLLVLLAVASGAPVEKEFYDLKDAPSLFEKFIKDYNKTYKDAADKEVHYQAFKNTLNLINESNSKQSSATFGLNRFADRTPEELKQMLGVLPNSLTTTPALA